MGRQNSKICDSKYKNIRVKEAFDANYNDLGVKDKIVIIHNEDQDLDDWYQENGYGILTIKSIDIESGLCWVEEECPYAIQLACALKTETE